MLQATRTLRADLAMQTSNPRRFDDVGRMMATVRNWNVASEKVFLDLGEELQTLFRNVSQVRDGIGRSTEIFASDEIAEMRHGLKTAAEDTRAVAALAIDRGAALSRLGSAVDFASTGSAAVLLVFRLLDYVVLIARALVEGMSEGKEELGPFTIHVDELVSQGERVARGIDERTQLLGRFLCEARTIEMRSGTDGNSMIDDFAALAGRLETRQQSSATGREAAHAAFTSIWKAIGGIVTGLQFHDRMRQRLEHTIANIALMPELERSGAIGEGIAPIGPALRPVALRRIAAIEIAQLDDLARLYEDEMAKLDANLSQIGEEIGRSEAILDQLVRGSGSSDGASSLDGEAARLRAHFEQGEKSRLKLGASLEKCFEATQSLIEMTGKLDELEHDLKIAGLNAAVQAAHVKGGDATIGYIARVICDQATVARSEADRVRKGIEMAVVETGELANRILPSITTAEGTIESRLTSTTAVLSQVEASYEGDIGAATTTARSLAADAARVRQIMMRQHGGHDMMRALAAGLSAAVADIADVDVGAEELADLDLILAAHYTMAEEREIFAAVTGLRVADAEPAPSEAAGASDDSFDDILF